MSSLIGRPALKHITVRSVQERVNGVHVCYNSRTVHQLLRFCVICDVVGVRNTLEAVEVPLFKQGRTAHGRCTLQTFVRNLKIFGRANFGLHLRLDDTADGVASSFALCGRIRNALVLTPIESAATQDDARNDTRSRGCG